MSDAALDHLVPADLRAWIETRFYAKVTTQAALTEAVKDNALWIDTANHVSFFSDHGVVHMRDVAQQLLRVLDTANGVLIPARPRERLDGPMKAFGVLAACLHDIGMADFSAFGRAMHPEFAAQAVFTPEFDAWIDQVWQADCGGLTHMLQTLDRAGALRVPARVALRELLAMSMCHSKRKVPIALFNDPARLRQLLLRTVRSNLRALYAETGDTPNPDAARVYAGCDMDQHAFAWLESSQPEVRALRDDALDTLRALRCADALRQRGTVMRTSAGYELFVSRQTANVVVTLRDAHYNALLLELPNGGIGAGEANLASSELASDGHLRLSFHRGSFATAAAFEQAVADAALVVADIQGDVIASFSRPDKPDPAIAQRARAMRIQLEGTDDNPEFVHAMQQHLTQAQPAIGERVEIVPSLRHTSALERDRYLAAQPIHWTAEQRAQFLDHLARNGHKIDDIDPQTAFEHVKAAALNEGELLVTAGTPAGFVYVALDHGLWVLPLGGYDPVAVPPWQMVGNTGVIRGAERNADIVARGGVQVIILPKDVYLRHWYRPFSVAELRQRLQV